MYNNQNCIRFCVLLVTSQFICSMDTESLSHKELVEQQSDLYWIIVNAVPRAENNSKSENDSDSEIESPVTGKAYIKQLIADKESSVTVIENQKPTVSLMRLHSNIDVNVVEMIIEKMRCVFNRANAFHDLYLENKGEGLSPENIRNVVREKSKKSEDFSNNPWLGAHTLYQLYTKAIDPKKKFISLFNTADDKKQEFNHYNPKTLLIDGGLIKGKVKEYALKTYVEDVVLYIVQKEKQKYRDNEYTYIIDFNPPELQQLKKSCNDGSYGD